MNVKAHKQITPCSVLSSLMAASPTLTQAITDSNDLAFDTKEWIEIAEMPGALTVDPMSNLVFELTLEIDDGAILTITQGDNTHTTCDIVLMCDSDGVTERASRLVEMRLGDIIDLPPILAPLADYIGTADTQNIDRNLDDSVTYVPLKLMVSAQERIMRQETPTKIDITQDEPCDVLTLIMAAKGIN